MTLRAENLAKSYKGSTVVKDVSLTVEKAQIVGLLGPNGAGKTSLIRIINQITGPDSGEVLFNGEKLTPKHVDFGQIEPNWGDHDKNEDE